MGDEAFYASSVWALASHPLGWPNLGNEGENFSYFNMLLPAVGAALRPLLGLDVILFTASAATMAALNAALGLHAFLSSRPVIRFGSFESVVLVLAVSAASWFPTWLVSSPQVAFVVPLTIAVWFWTRERDVRDSTVVATALAALFGALLTKVVVAASLVVLTLPRLIVRLRSFSSSLRVVVAAAGVIAIGGAALMLYAYGALFFSSVKLGPDSFVALVYEGGTVRSAWPMLAHDLGIVLMVVAAFRLMSMPNATALMIGALAASFYPFLMRANFICVAVVLALAAIENPDRLARNRWLVLGAYVLTLPAIIVSEPSGKGTAWIWFATSVGLVISALPLAGKRNWSRGAALWFATTAAATAIVLAGAARGTLPVPPGDGQLKPAVQDIWRAVRERTRSDTLVFTDQTGREPRLLTGWNTYAASGQRQIFIANWYQSRALRTDANARERRLQMNDDVLAGRRSPDEVPTRGSYDRFAAVVALAHRMPPPWKLIYSNTDYALYEWSAVAD
jgi:hypothetical protein